MKKRTYNEINQIHSNEENNIIELLKIKKLPKLMYYHNINEELEKNNIIEGGILCNKKNDLFKILITILSIYI